LLLTAPDPCMSAECENINKQFAVIAQFLASQSKFTYLSFISFFLLLIIIFLTQAWIKVGIGPGHYKTMMSQYVTVHSML